MNLAISPPIRPMPAEGIGSPAVDRKPGQPPPPSHFEQLLQALRQEHERKITSLRAENASTRRMLGEGSETIAATNDSSFAQVGKATAQRTLSALSTREGAGEASVQLMKLTDRTISWSSAGRSRIVKGERSPWRSRGEPKARQLQRMESLVTLPPLWPVWCNPAASAESGKFEKALSKAMHNHLHAESHLIRSSSGRSVRATLSGMFPLQPDSTFRMMWDVLSLIFLLYDLYAIPLQVFDIEDVPFFKAGGWVTLMFWSLDIVISFNSCYMTRYGDVVGSFRMIASRYVRTWFGPDILIVGIEWCVVFMEAYMGRVASSTASYARMSKFMRVARILRALRMSRMAKIKDLLYALQNRIDSEWLSIAWGLFTNVFILITLNHVTACGWYFVGTRSIDWELGGAWPRAYGYENASEISTYLCALHWSLTLFTPASMNHHAVNDLERSYTIFNLVLAMVIFASFVSSVTAGFTRLRSLEAESWHQRFLLRKYLRETNISSMLSARILRYIDVSLVNHRKKVSYDSVTLLRWLSGPLNVELHRELCSPFLEVHPFFSKYVKASHSAVNEICFSACSFWAVAKHDTLFARFARAKQMFIVVSGTLAYRRATALPAPKYTKLSENSYCGEPAIWVQWVSHGTVKALTESDCMAIDAAKFGEITASHRDVFKMTCESAAEFNAGLLACFKSHGSAWDLPLAMIGSDTYGLAGEGEVAFAEAVEAQIVDWSDSECSDAGDESDGNSEAAGDEIAE